MPWNKNDYPNSMKNLSKEVRNKAIDIANALLDEKSEMDEGIVIATAISRAKDWGSDKDISVEANDDGVETANAEEQEKDQNVISIKKTKRTAKQVAKKGKQAPAVKPKAMKGAKAKAKKLKRPVTGKSPSAKAKKGAPNKPKKKAKKTKMK